MIHSFFYSPLFFLSLLNLIFLFLLLLILLCLFAEAPKQFMGARNLSEKGSGQGSTYGQGAVLVETAKSAPKPPTSVNQANKMEVMHQGVAKYTGTQ